MELKVIGYLCPKITQTLVNASAAASEYDDPVEINWISDAHGIAKMGSTTSPAIIINGKLRLMGRVPSVYELSRWIGEEVNEEAVA